MSKRVENREVFLVALRNLGKDTVSFTELKALAGTIGINFPNWFTNEPSNKVSRGLYRVPGVTTTKVQPTEPVAVNMAASVTPIEVARKRISTISTNVEEEDLIPRKYGNYVPFGNFNDIHSIITSKKFFPVFVTGQSGNGKTMSIEQAAAKARRKFIVVSMTPETDEGDLLGNYVLIDGEMVWRDGPVTVAARQGAVLCLDEIDYGAQNLSTLQRVLEGKPFLLKKKNELVHPTEGFTIFATANTKGKGSDDGRYMFTNVLNEAFLERFPVTMEQDWAPPTVEKKIIAKELISAGYEDEEFASRLVNWADVIRKSFTEGAADEVISTRRLVHIAKTYGIFGDKLGAIKLCLNRFDEDTKASFLDLYTKIDVDVTAPVPEVATISNEVLPDEDISF